jgi:hypothetical protein
MFTIARSLHDGLMRIALGLLSAAILSFAGCGDDTTTTPGADMAATVADLASMMCTGGPVAGPLDRHCYDDGGSNFISVDPTMCTIDAGADNGGFGDTMNNSAGNDDDCKYFVSFTTSGGICKGSGVYFTTSLKDSIMMQPVPHATNVRPEVFNTTTMAPVNTSTSMTSETAAGVYKIGPITFPSSGGYTVRFHFFENCTDTPSSPHGHAAFFINVP